MFPGRPTHLAELIIYPAENRTLFTTKLPRFLINHDFPGLYPGQNLNAFRDIGNCPDMEGCPHPRPQGLQRLS